jgi:hypothetical protein
LVGNELQKVRVDLLKHLKQSQSVNEVTIIQQAAGGVRLPKRRKYILIKTRLEQLKLRLQANKLSMVNMLTPQHIFLISTKVLYMNFLSVVQYADAAAYLLNLD